MLTDDTPTLSGRVGSPAWLFAVRLFSQTPSGITSVIPRRMRSHAVRVASAEESAVTRSACSPASGWPVGVVGVTIAAWRAASICCWSCCFVSVRSATFERSPSTP
jgi:hypothetical protein